MFVFSVTLTHFRARTGNAQVAVLKCSIHDNHLTKLTKGLNLLSQNLVWGIQGRRSYLPQGMNDKQETALSISIPSDHGGNLIHWRSLLPLLWPIPNYSMLDPHLTQKTPQETFGSSSHGNSLIIRCSIQVFSLPCNLASP